MFAGEYTVRVTDKNGCSGISSSVRVNVIDAKNKVQINSNGEIPIAAHAVGDVVCLNISVTNTSAIEALVISKPFFIGNVFFSVPQGQFPIIIGSRQQAELQCCAMATELGFIRDTLVIPDTCSSTLVPFVTEGLPVQFSGTSRCSVAIDAIKVRAGGTWKLFPPYPSPSSDYVNLELRADNNTATDTERITADVVDTYGRIRTHAKNCFWLHLQ